jgi:hypothetical protein
VAGGADKGLEVVVRVDPLRVSNPSFDVVAVGRIRLVGDGGCDCRIESDVEFQDNGELVREASAVDQVLELGSTAW